MYCYHHPDRDAVGACVACNKAVCPECKVEYGGKVYCNSCIEKMASGGVVPATAITAGNTSGMGSKAPLPPGLGEWNWGGFLLTWIWGIGNNVWIALVALAGIIPYVGWVISIGMAIVLGVHGNEWAWQKKSWDSIEHFRKTQRTWIKWGVGMLVLQLLLMISIAVLVISLIMIATSGGAKSNFDWRQLLPRY